jgi:hypothetical protein
MARAPLPSPRPPAQPPWQAEDPATGPVVRRFGVGRDVPPGPRPRARTASPPPRRWDNPPTAAERRAQAAAYVVDTRTARPASAPAPRPWPYGRR